MTARDQPPSSGSQPNGPATVVPSHGFGRIRPWHKGQSGNPSGRQGDCFEVRRICADNSIPATHKLIALLDSDDDRVVFMAIKEIYDRGIGKPRDHSNETGGRIDLSALTAEERAAMVAMLQKSMGL